MFIYCAEINKHNTYYKKFKTEQKFIPQYKIKLINIVYKDIQYRLLHNTFHEKYKKLYMRLFSNDSSKVNQFNTIIQNSLNYIKMFIDTDDIHLHIVWNKLVLTGCHYPLRPIYTLLVLD